MRNVFAEEVEDWQIFQPGEQIRVAYSVIAPLTKKQNSQLLDAARVNLRPHAGES